MKLPPQVVGGYWTSWGSPIRLSAIPAEYNTVFLFHATPVGGQPGTTGAVQWNKPGDSRGAGSNLKNDLKVLRERACVLLSVGGANAAITLSSRTRSQAFLDSVSAIYTQLGGFDGLDWNNYEGEYPPNPTEMIWVSQQLKARYGTTFAITTPPAPHRATDKALVQAMAKAGVLDMASPQYYDWGDGLSSAAHIPYITGTSGNAYPAWVARTGSAALTGVGMKHSGGTGTGMTVNDLVTAMKQLRAKYPTMRGGFVWELPQDEKQAWAFAKQVGPILNPSGPVKPVEPTPPAEAAPTPPVLVAGATVRIGTGSYPLAGVNVRRGTDQLVAYTFSSTQTRTTTNIYGAEVGVVESKVASVVDRQTTGTGGVNIPSTGYVLSGHGKARTFLLNNARIGSGVVVV